MLDSKGSWEKEAAMFLPGFGLRPFRVLGKHDNHYITETPSQCTALPHP